MTAVAMSAALLVGGVTTAGAEAPAPIPPIASVDVDTIPVAPVAFGPEEVYTYVTYMLLFSREPDAAGLSYWATALRDGTPRRAVADFLTSSDEFRSGIIWRDYDHFLGREPDQGGLAYWLQQMRKGVTIQQMEAGFIASPEYIANAGSTAKWVQALYSDVLGRDASDAEVAYWAAAYDSHQLKADQIALGFLLSTELLSSQIGGEYLYLLNRESDAAGVAFWVKQIQGGVRYENVIGSIVGSDEFWNLTQSIS
jgi:hypothetical protein